MFTDNFFIFALESDIPVLESSYVYISILAKKRYFFEEQSQSFRHMIRKKLPQIEGWKTVVWFREKEE